MCIRDRNYGVLSIERIKEQVDQLVDLEVLTEGEITATDVHVQVTLQRN